MDFKKGKNGSDIGSNKLENYHFKIFDMVDSAIRNFYIFLYIFIFIIVRGYEYFWVRA